MLEIAEASDSLSKREPSRVATLGRIMREGFFDYRFPALQTAASPSEDAISVATPVMVSPVRRIAVVAWLGL